MELNFWEKEELYSRTEKIMRFLRREDTLRWLVWTAALFSVVAIVLCFYMVKLVKDRDQQIANDEAVILQLVKGTLPAVKDDNGKMFSALPFIFDSLNKINAKLLPSPTPEPSKFSIPK